MDFLQTFDARNLAGQILLLDEIDRENRAEAIPDLIALYTSPQLDVAVRRTTGDTLRSLLSRNEAQTVAGLTSPNAEVRRLSLEVTLSTLFPSASGPLTTLAETEGSPEILVQILSALVAIDAVSALRFFRLFAAHEDPFVSAVAIQALGKCKDGESLGRLQQIVVDAEKNDRYQSCSVATEEAILALGCLEEDGALEFLVAKIHHRNPTARRFIHQEITRHGARAVPLLARTFGSGGVDEKILAANLLGSIGDRRGSDALVSAMDHGDAGNPNVRFAIYEALGQIPSLKGVVCLVDAMGEQDDMTLVAVAAALDRQLNPGVAARVIGNLKEHIAARAPFLRAVVSSRATGLFEHIYRDKDLSAEILDAVRACTDPETMGLLRDRLLSLGTPKAGADAATLVPAGSAPGAGRVLAVDDSRSMLLFYRSVASALGLSVTTAGNGREALDLLEQGELFDLILTDLNMPVMDGIEFTRKARENLYSCATPIVMATTESDGPQKSLAAAAGVTGFLNKPLKPDLLTETIRQHLPLQ